MGVCTSVVLSFIFWFTRINIMEIKMLVKGLYLNENCNKISII